MTAVQSTFWSEEHLANLSPLQDFAVGWMTRVATWPCDSLNLLASFGQPGWCGRTSPECCHRQEDGILAPSSGRWQNSGMGSPTAFLTLSGLESPSVAAVCSLSHTLETGDVPQRYFLSQKACSGILRRAERRGKELPSDLHCALAQTAATEKTRKPMCQTSRLH